MVLIERQNSIAGDSTKSFNEIQEAAEKAAEATVKQARIEKQAIKQRRLRLLEDLA